MEDRTIYGESNVCGVQLEDRKGSTDLMFMLGFSETIDQLAMTNSVRWYGHVSRREDGHVLRRAFVCQLQFGLQGMVFFEAGFYTVFLFLHHVSIFTQCF